MTAHARNQLSAPVITTVISVDLLWDRRPVIIDVIGIRVTVKGYAKVSVIEKNP
jgi:hypothetical protein